jgi:hypothetical protein
MHKSPAWEDGGVFGIINPQSWEWTSIFTQWLCGRFLALDDRFLRTVYGLALSEGVGI